MAYLAIQSGPKGHHFSLPAPRFNGTLAETARQTDCGNLLLTDCHLDRGEAICDEEA
jgi:hypothetical protein